MTSPKGRRGSAMGVRGNAIGKCYSQSCVESGILPLELTRLPLPVKVLETKKER